ncbi:MAG: 2-oxo-4-hydroxy-4-carboxy-5-ureidoimidazoline decarboxylase [Gammaproteobacteria bacterium]
MPDKISLASLNQYSRERFVESLGGIFEHSPWVADLVYEKRPFESIPQLNHTMLEVVQQSPEVLRMALICNHPELAGNEAAAGTLTDDSRQEQSRAGLDQCSADELAQLQSLNQAYLEKFDFPFVIAVTGLNKTRIIEALHSRLKNSLDREFETSIVEIGKIADIRLNSLLVE